jgi:hypothetical protein
MGGKLLFRAGNCFFEGYQVGKPASGRAKNTEFSVLIDSQKPGPLTTDYTDDTDNTLNLEKAVHNRKGAKFAKESKN